MTKREFEMGGYGTEVLAQAFGISSWPVVHPNTGERIVSVSVTRRRELHQTVSLPPLRPTREVWSYDEDDNEVFVRERSEAELAEAIAAYEKALAKHRATGGVHVTAEPTSVEASFVGEHGSKFSAMWYANTWKVLSIDWPVA